MSLHEYEFRFEGSIPQNHRLYVSGRKTPYYFRRSDRTGEWQFILREKTEEFNAGEGFSIEQQLARARVALAIRYEKGEAEYWAS